MGGQACVAHSFHREQRPTALSTQSHKQNVRRWAPVTEQLRSLLLQAKARGSGFLSDAQARKGEVPASTCFRKTMYLLFIGFLPQSTD